LDASYFGLRTCMSSLNLRFSTIVYGLRSVTWNVSIWFMITVDREELNGIFCLTSGVSFKDCCFATGWESGLLSLSDIRVYETKIRESEDEVDEYSRGCLFKCWIMFVVFPDLLRSYKSCRQLVLFYSQVFLSSGGRNVSKQIIYTILEA